MTDEKQISTAKALYYALGFTLIISIIPNMVMATIAPLTYIIVLIAAYMMRAKASKDSNDPETSLLFNHASFIISSIWIATFISLITLAIGSAYMLPRIDYAAFELCASTIESLGAGAVTMGYAQLMQLAQPCMDEFLAVNHSTFITTTLISGVPVIGYLIYRGVKGAKLAFKGEPVPNRKSWL